MYSAAQLVMETTHFHKAIELNLSKRERGELIVAKIC